MCSFDIYLLHESAHVDHYFNIWCLLLSVLALVTSIFILLRKLLVFFSVWIVLVRLLILAILANALVKPNSLAVQIVLAHHKLSWASTILRAKTAFQSTVGGVEWTMGLHIIAIIGFLTVIRWMRGHSHNLFCTINVQSGFQSVLVIVWIQLFKFIIFYNKLAINL